MPKQHGEYDSKQQKWFCGYWMSQEEWLDVHDYSPPTMLQNQGKEPFSKEDDNDDDTTKTLQTTRLITDY